MRFVLVFLAALTAVPAFAQPVDKPLPPPPVIIEFLRSTFGAMFGDLTTLTPQGGPGMFRATTSASDLPQYDLRLFERDSPQIDFEKEANDVIGSARNNCQPWRQRGWANDPFHLNAMTMVCGTGSEQQIAWVLVFSNNYNARTIMVSVPVSQSGALIARGDRQMAALNMTAWPQPRNLAEAVLIAYAYAGFIELYKPEDASVPSPATAVLKAEKLMASDAPGTYEVEAPNCGSIMVREVTAGPPRFVESELRIDLAAVRNLATREGLNLRVRAGAYGEAVRHFAQRPAEPIRRPEEVEAGVFTGDAPTFIMMDAYLFIYERFCAGTAPVSAQAPAPAQQAPAAAQAPAVAQAPAAAQPPAVAQAPATPPQQPAATPAPALAAPIRTLTSLPQGAELDALVQRLVRSVLPDATVTKANQPSAYNITAGGRLFVASMVGTSISRPEDRDFSDQALARTTQISGCEAPQRVVTRMEGDVGAVGWTAACPRFPGAMFIGVFHDARNIHMFTFVGIGADRAVMERAGVIMAQPFAFNETAAGDPLATMEERAVYFLFYGLRRDAAAGLCKAPNVSRSVDGRTLTFVSKCDDSPEWTQTVTIEPRSACRYGYTFEHDIPHMEEREEGELDFSEVDWSGIKPAGNSVLAEKVVAARVNFIRMGPSSKPRYEGRHEQDRPKDIRLDEFDVPNFEGQWHAIVRAFRAQCPGKG